MEMHTSCSAFKKNIAAHYAGDHTIHSDNRKANELYQTSIMSALLEGVYEGEVTFGELKAHGDFGIGTFNDLDGEMLAVDGNFYQLRSDGTASLVNDDQLTPFAVVTFFKEQLVHQIEALIDKAGFQTLLDTLVPSANLFYAIRINGTFSKVDTRTVSIQKKPFISLTEVANEQTTFHFESLEGTMAGFRSPDYAQGLTVAGYHLHFIDSNRSRGGHVLDFVLDKGTVMIDTYSSIHVELPQTADFEQAKIAKDNSSDIKKAEG